MDGKAFSAQLSVSGAKGAVTWKGLGLPTGLTLAATSGKLSGTPSVSGKFPIAVMVTDSSKPARVGGAVYQLTVGPKPKS